MRAALRSSVIWLFITPPAGEKKRQGEEEEDEEEVGREAAEMLTVGETLEV